MRHDRAGRDSARARGRSGRGAILSARYRWLVIIGWLLLVVLAVVGKNAAGGSFANDLSVSGTDSQAAYETMQQRFPDLSGDPMQIVIRARSGHR